MKNRLAAAVALCLLPLVAHAQDEPKPPVDKPPAAPPTTDPSREKEKEKPKWDVANPPYPFDVDVPLDVDSGTWMSLDVSPDGKEIVFDLLGDIYTMPIAGGEARPLTSGIAWDMQPRYSPDGKWIAFTSDRSRRRQHLDHGPRRLQAAAGDQGDLPPAQQPGLDARRAVHRGAQALHRHALARRRRDLALPPLGRRGPADDQAGAPSRRTTASPPSLPTDATSTGPRTPRPERSSSTTRIRTPRSTSSSASTGKPARSSTSHRAPAGRSARRPRPTASRSPSSAASATRRRSSSRTSSPARAADLGRPRARHAGDLGDPRRLSGHGVDARLEVRRRCGRAARSGASTCSRSRSREIPFQVKDTRKAATAVRFGVDVLTGVMQASMSPRISDPLANPQGGFPKNAAWCACSAGGVSPDGKRVAYQALGYIYLRDLPNGEPPPPHEADRPLRVLPVLVARREVHRLHDLERRDARRDPRGGGAGGRLPRRDLETRPLLRPRLLAGRHEDRLPQGLRRPAAFDRLVGRSRPVLDRGLGHRRPAQPHRRGRLPAPLRQGIRPRLLRQDRGRRRPDRSGKRVFASIELDGSDAHDYYLSELATEFAVSPDGKWLAFREGFNAYVTPFIETGRRVDIGPKSKAVPRHARVEGSGGVHPLRRATPPAFTGPSDRTSTSATSRKPSRFFPARPRSCPTRRRNGLTIGFPAPVRRSLRHASHSRAARVVTMNGAEVIEDGVVVVEGNRIKAVGKRGTVAVPAGAKTVDVDRQDGPARIRRRALARLVRLGRRRPAAELGDRRLAGVRRHDRSTTRPTTRAKIFAATELARAGMIRAPRIFSTGTILYGAAGDFKADIESLEDAVAHLRRMKAVGAISVKSYQQPRREQRQQLLAGARERRHHGRSGGRLALRENMTMVVDGHTTIEHAIPVPHIYEDVLSLWPPGKVGYTPTILVGYGGNWGENYWYQKTNVWENPRLSKFVPPFVLDPRSRRRIMAPDDEFNHFDVARIATALDKAGVIVNTGAHGQREGLGLHWELWMLVQGGMTPHEALRCATANGAKSLGMDRDIGTLQAGKLADVIVIDGDPLKDIRQSERVAWTMINGRLYDAATMTETGARERKRARYWWEP